MATQVRGKLLTLNYNILKTAERSKLKFGEKAFLTFAFPKISVNREKLDINALLTLFYAGY